MIALIITINKYDIYFSSEILTFTCDNITNTYEKLINTLIKYFNINIDFPNELSEFEYLWFDKQYTKLSTFTYNIFSNNEWSTPWECQSIYDDILEKINELEIKEAPDFSKMYGELNYDDNDLDDNALYDKDLDDNDLDDNDLDDNDLDDNDLDNNSENKTTKNMIARQKSNFFENNKINNDINEDYLELEKKFKEIINNTIINS